MNQVRRVHASNACSLFAVQDPAVDAASGGNLDETSASNSVDPTETGEEDRDNCDGGRVDDHTELGEEGLDRREGGLVD